MKPCPLTCLFSSNRASLSCPCNTRAQKALDLRRLKVRVGGLCTAPQIRLIAVTKTSARCAWTAKWTQCFLARISSAACASSNGMVRVSLTKSRDLLEESCPMCRVNKTSKDFTLLDCGEQVEVDANEDLAEKI